MDETLKSALRMDTFKNKTVQYGISTNETIQYFNGIVNSTLLHYYPIKFVVNSHVLDPGKSLINVFAVVIIKNETLWYGTFWNDTGTSTSTSTS